MDGNRRWAEKKNLKKIDGHKMGIETAKEISIESNNLGIKEITLYAFSFQNWNRPKVEIESLFNLFYELFEDKSKFFSLNSFIFNPIGRIDLLNNVIKKKLINLKNVTQNNKKLKINVAINYGGIEEIIDTFKNLVNANINLEDLNEDTLRQYSYLPISPSPELIIRTGGYNRISNFLNLHNSYSEIIISNKLWPDFTKDDFISILNEYQSIERNHGK
tara:strand:- start:33741 stop:34394 length:654 start_codon:yes stop_codon:yes gene_type:complete